MNKKRLYFYLLISFAVVSGAALVRLFDSIQQNDKTKIIGAGLLLLGSTVTFVLYSILLRKQVKNESKN